MSMQDYYLRASDIDLAHKNISYSLRSNLIGVVFAGIALCVPVKHLCQYFFFEKNCTENPLSSFDLLWTTAALAGGLYCRGSRRFAEFEAAKLKVVDLNEISTHDLSALPKPSLLSREEMGKEQYKMEEIVSSKITSIELVGLVGGAFISCGAQLGWHDVGQFITQSKDLSFMGNIALDCFAPITAGIASIKVARLTIKDLQDSVPRLTAPAPY